ncbi:MAG: hypothetical protein EHM47_16670, partial [Ignavibacteriales bacterium]
MYVIDFLLISKILKKISHFLNLPKKYNLTLSIVISISSFQLTAFSQSIPLNHLSTANGLSNNTVFDVLQDKTGFIWFATGDGLNRYDGYEFKIFRHNPDDANSLSDNTIWSFTEDKYGK